MVSVNITIPAILAIIFGVIILIFPKSLNYLVAIWLIINGGLQLLGNAF